MGLFLIIVFSLVFDSLPRMDVVSHGLSGLEDTTNTAEKTNSWLIWSTKDANMTGRGQNPFDQDER